MKKSSDKSLLDSMESGDKKSRKKDKEREKDRLDSSMEKKIEKDKKKDKDKGKDKKKKKSSDEETGGCGFCKWIIFSTMMMLLSIPMLLDLELVKNLVRLNGYGSESVEEFFVSNEDIIGPGINNAEVNEVVGYIKAGKNCAVFYTDNPNANEQAIATRVCPQEHDADIIFHMKSIFGTHPDANNTHGESSVVRYIVSGGNTWTTFFDQHNTTRQTYTVPPSLEMNVSTLIGSDVETFPELFDAVSLVLSVGAMRPTRGLQMRFPECVNFYAAFAVRHLTSGYMVCRLNKRVDSLIFDKVKLQELGYLNGLGEMPELTYIVAGARSAVKIEFAPADGEDAEPLPLSSISVSFGKTNKNTNNEVYDMAPAIGSQWKLRPKLITISFRGDDVEDEDKEEGNAE